MKVGEPERSGLGGGAHEGRQDSRTQNKGMRQGGTLRGERFKQGVGTEKTKIYEKATWKPTVLQAN